VKVPVASGIAVTSFSVVNDTTRNATSNLTPNTHSGVQSG
jgi:hypothetical protein